MISIILFFSKKSPRFNLWLSYLLKQYQIQHPVVSGNLTKEEIEQLCKQDLKKALTSPKIYKQPRGIA